MKKALHSAYALHFSLGDYPPVIIVPSHAPTGYGKEMVADALASGALFGYYCLSNSNDLDVLRAL